MRFFGQKSAAPALEKRAVARGRAHLRLGKIISAGNRPLAECSFYDLSISGARLRLKDNIPLPNRVRIFDAAHEIVRVADIIWRRDLELGLRFASGPLFVNESEVLELNKDLYPQPGRRPLTRWSMIPFPHANCPHCQRSIGVFPSFRAQAASKNEMQSGNSDQ